MVIAVNKVQVISHLTNNVGVKAYKFPRNNGFLITYNIENLSFESSILSQQDIDDLVASFGSRIVDLEVVGYQAQALDLQALSNILRDDILDGAPSSLDTLKELAAALNDDSNFASNVANQISNIESQVSASSSQIASLQSASLGIATNSTLISSHVSDTSNPHSVTASQVGLGNVPDIDATDRSNHTGTQLSSTISDFNQAIASYLDRHSSQSDSIVIANDSLVWFDVFSETFSISHSAKYVVRLSYTWAYDNSASNFQAELLINNLTVSSHVQEPKDSSGIVLDGSGTSQSYLGHMEYLVDLSPHRTFGTRQHPCILYQRARLGGLT